MNSDKFRMIVISLAAVSVMGCALMPALASAAFFQKRFMVCKDRGRDILCDPYIVQKNDYVTKLFKQRGQIAYEDFPKFLSIFKRINPDIKDIDKIYPNQKILIPLKLLAPGTLEGQSTGMVTIPIITITNLPNSMLQNSSLYEVQSGDTVSKLILAQFGALNRQEYERVLELFKYMNPDLEDIDLIRVGEKIRLPDPAIRNASWYDDAFDSSGRVKTKEPFEAPAPEPEPPETEQTAVAPEPKPKPKPSPATENQAQEAKVRVKSPETPEKKPEITKKEPEPASPPEPVRLTPIYKRGARVLNARLLDEGDFYFPREGLSDVKVELSQTPVMELPDGSRLLFDQKGAIREKEAAAIKRFWKNIRIVRLKAGAGLRDLFQEICPIIDEGGCESRLAFSDNGISVTVRAEYIYDNLDGDGEVCLTFIRRAEEQTQASIRRYLAQHWIVVDEWIDRADFFAKAHQSMRDDTRQDETDEVSSTVITATTPSEFVRRLAERLGYNYQEDVEISFPYAGFQVNAWTNVLSVGPNSEVLIDFGDLQGDAITSIEDTGFQVIQIRGGNDYYQMARQLLSELPVNQMDAPVFWAAERRRIHNTSFRVPGTVVSIAGKSEKEKKILITGVEVPPELRYYLADKGFEVIQVHNPIPQGSG